MSTKKDAKPFAIRRLKANQIGPFAQLDIEFPEKRDRNKAEVHILTGENGTGKSTVLQMLANCVPDSNELLQKKVKSDTTSNYRITFSDAITALYDKVLISAHDGNEFVKSIRKEMGELLPDNFPTPIKKWAYEDPKERLDTGFFSYSGYRKLSSSTVESISDLKVNPFENALNFDKSTDTKTLVNWLTNTITKSALAMAKGRSEDRERAEIYDLPIKQLEKVISDITDQPIKFELQESPLAILIHVDRQPLEFEQLPDGLKSIVSWLGDLIMRLDRIKWSTSEPLTNRNFILFLDEIEIHLHPAWQRKILPIVQHLFPNAQIFISTHSPFVVGSVDGAWVHRFFKDKHGHSQLQGEPALSEDSNSYEYILSEVFGINERFGIEVERDLQEFKTIRNQIMHDVADYDIDHFQQLINKLMSQSPEVQSIIGMELRQLSRITKKSFA